LNVLKDDEKNQNPTYKKLVNKITHKIEKKTISVDNCLQFSYIGPVKIDKLKTYLQQVGFTFVVLWKRKLENYMSSVVYLKFYKNWKLFILIHLYKLIRQYIHRYKWYHVFSVKKSNRMLIG